MTGALETAFDERLAEVFTYLDFLDELEAAVLTGAPRFVDSSRALSPNQTQILRAGVFIQLYNLVEATMTRCLDAMATASSNGGWKAAQLSDKFRREWVKVVAASNVEMNAEKRLNYAVALTEILVRADPLAEFRLEKGGGGNWDDKVIEQMLERVGLRLILTPTVRVAAKRPYRDGKGPLEIVVKLRNDLAHGNISFAECGQNETAPGLRELSDKTAMYLRTVVRAVQRYIDRFEFLHNDSRPNAGEAA